MPLSQLLIATHNKGKVAEFDKLLHGLDIELKSAADFELPEPIETESTFVGNALLKARAAFEGTGVASLADDSGLSVDALGGAPGIYSARWAEKPDGTRDFTFAMERINEELNAIDGTQMARFVAVLALIKSDGSEEIFEGEIEGKLCWPPRGDKGFGYDPMFIPNGYEMTFAEMDASQKHDISHRAVAVTKFKDYLINNV